MFCGTSSRIKDIKRINANQFDKLSSDLRKLQAVGKPMSPKRFNIKPECDICGQEPDFYKSPFIEFNPSETVLQIIVSAEYKCYKCKDSEHSEPHKWIEFLEVKSLDAECDDSKYSSSDFIKFSKNEHNMIDLFMRCKCSSKGYWEELNIFEIDNLLKRLMFRYSGARGGGSYYSGSQSRTLPAFQSLEAIVLTPDGIKFRISPPEYWLFYKT